MLTVNQNRASRIYKWAPEKRIQFIIENHDRVRIYQSLWEDELTVWLYSAAMEALKPPSIRCGRGEGASLSLSSCRAAISDLVQNDGQELSKLYAVARRATACARLFHLVSFIVNKILFVHLEFWKRWLQRGVHEHRLSYS